jgi:hypothetical protein
MSSQNEKMRNLDVMARRTPNKGRVRVSIEMPIDRQSEIGNELFETPLRRVDIMLTSFLGNTKFRSDSPAVRVFNRFKWAYKYKN